MFNIKATLPKIKTPAYIYDLDGIKARAHFFKNQMPANSCFHFAMKANHHPEVLKTLKAEGFGVDVVSWGELKHALDLGFKASDIVFSGVGKTEVEIRNALEASIAQINVESFPELERIALIARSLSKKAKVALRMNPDVVAKTHPYIQTGFRENKFGLDFSEIPNLLQFFNENKNSVELQGLTLHIGSQIRAVEPFRQAILKTLELYKDLRSKGFSVTTFDVGGGLGIDYLSADLKVDEQMILSYAKIIKDCLENQVDKILFEPGRILVGRFGFLVGEVQYIKKTPYKNFVILNTGMHHLLRPALYEAYHRIEVVEDKKAAPEQFDVVGPICESSDVLGFERLLPADLKSGDHLVICDAGAYGSVMSSDYNLHARPQEYAISKGNIL